MDSGFFERPILNSPYAYPARHWELDAQGQPTGRIIEARRTAQFITPVPRPKKHKRSAGQERLVFDEGAGVSTAKQEYDPTPIINELRHRVDQWRGISNPSAWGVTPETARLLQHWRHHEFTGVCPFFCQIEAVETVIWLTEVAPNERQGKGFLEHLANANNDANPELMRLALKLATGAGKTTVMAMLIAWQTVNAVRRPQSRRFTRGFLVVTPGITIKDRLRVLYPNGPDSYYANRELVPGDMLDDVNRAKIVITNYHGFKRREQVDLSKGGRALLQGRVGASLDTMETEGKMLQRVMPGLMGLKSIVVLNDEAHHCYREKPPDEDVDDDLKGDERKEAERNNEAARLWISGLEAVNRKLGVARVIDLSATPFFLRGSGYAEGTLFPWTMSDFSLMDAIECGIVKLPRVPVAENVPGDDMPMFRNLWENIRKDMPKKGHQELADMACNRITAAITAAFASERPIKAVPDSYNPVGSTSHVRFNTSRPHRWETDPARCHVNWVVLDSDWEAEFCRVAESHPRVKAYVKNHNLGLEVPYRYGSEMRRYLPDFIVLVDDGHGADDLLHLVVEIKGYRREDAKEKKATMDTYWVPAVNNLRTLGRWAFAELTEIYQIEADFEAKVASAFDEMIARAGSVPPALSA